MENKYFIVNTDGNVTYGLSGDIEDFKEVFTDFFAFYNKNKDLMFILPKKDIKSIIAKWIKTNWFL